MIVSYNHCRVYLHAVFHGPTYMHDDDDDDDDYSDKESINVSNRTEPTKLRHVRFDVKSTKAISPHI